MGTDLKEYDMGNYAAMSTVWPKAQEPAVGREVPVPEAPKTLLTDILATKRAHASLGDINFRQWLVKHLEGQKPQFLAEGVIYLHIGTSETLFSCHVDTCHGQKESDGSRQKLLYDSLFGDIILDKAEKSACLGADDGNGIYLMLSMIQAGKPGGYIFNTGEEQGGVGCRAVLYKNPEVLKKYKRTVAFDRAVQRNQAPEVIVTQGGSPCASTAAGSALVKALNSTKAVFEHDWVISHGGTFTDTKVFAGLIPEAFNLGAFYASQHTPHEWCNVSQLEQLLVAVLEVDWEALPVVRVVPPPYVYTPAKDTYSTPSNFKKPAKKKKQPVQDELDIPVFDVDFESMSYDEIEELVIDTEIVQGICGLLTALDAERGRVRRLQKLLGLV